MLRIKCYTAHIHTYTDAHTRKHETVGNVVRGAAATNQCTTSQGTEQQVAAPEQGWGIHFWSFSASLSINKGVFLHMGALAPEYSRLHFNWVSGVSGVALCAHLPLPSPAAPL
mmetsp:Transcript_14762/g.26219  ORF Transcript_14762/g.26219 Transcript_14762/m.26219 type:complete len:113 (+) Transcript_14762:364-702(+)